MLQEILEQILENQKKTNELLETLIFINRDALMLVMNQQPEVEKFFEEKINERSWGTGKSRLGIW